MLAEDIKTLPDLIVAAENVAMNIIQGSHGRRRVGMGESFWQFREYTAGDTARDIDWRQTAKRGSAFIRQMEWEASQTIVLWYDSSASMDYSSNLDKFLPKRHYAIVFLLSLASALLRGGETIMVAGHRPVQGYSSLPHVAEALLGLDNSLDNIGKIPKNSHGVFISDGLESLDIWAKKVEILLNNRLSVQFIQVLDTAEVNLPFTGNTVFEGMEGDGTAKIADVAKIRLEYQKKLQQHQNNLAGIVKKAGWSWHNFVTDVDMAEAVLPVYIRLKG